MPIDGCIIRDSDGSRLLAAMSAHVEAWKAAEESHGFAVSDAGHANEAPFTEYCHSYLAILASLDSLGSIAILFSRMACLPRSREDLSGMRAPQGIGVRTLWLLYPIESVVRIGAMPG